MAPAAGFEPATKWLTATYSTAELCRSVLMVLNIHHSLPISSAKMKKIVFFLLFLSYFYGSSAVCDRNRQKIIKNRKTELKKTGIAPVIRCLKKIFKWTGMDKSGQNERWSETVEANSEVHAVHKVHRRPCERRCFFSSKEIWVYVTNRRRGNKIRWLIKQAYGFRDREYFKLKIYQLPEISSSKETWVYVTNRRWGKKWWR